MDAVEGVPGVHDRDEVDAFGERSLNLSLYDEM